MSTEYALIKRIKYSPHGTFGAFLWGDLPPTCVTLELPWKDNLPRISCIPIGRYDCIRVNSPKFGNTFEITKVPNRSHILFHGANTIKDLLGCIGMAEYFTVFAGTAGVANPEKGAAMKEFLALTAGIDHFSLEIAYA